MAAHANLTLAALSRVWPQLGELEAGLARRLETDAKYSVYLQRQEEDIIRHRRSESLLIPDDLDYTSMPGLSAELRGKFLAARPSSIGQASRIEGVTPAGLALVTAHTKRSSRIRTHAK